MTFLGLETAPLACILSGRRWAVRQGSFAVPDRHSRTKARRLLSASLQ